MAAPRIVFRSDFFEKVLRSPETEVALQQALDQATAVTDAAPGKYASGVERGQTRSRAYVVTADFDAILDNAQQHTLARALGAINL